MRKHLERIRFRGQRRDEFPDLADSPNTSDAESNEEVVSRPRVSARDSEELREAEGEQSDAQPMVFGAMIHRDEAFDAIFNQHTKIVSAATAIEPEA
ncbi:hypothetical protein JOQ06_002862 [Pogonophryne albipinna]|uniref:Uncharacterized protein n=1 Tax=Pogonophryne albipinna TaxID=1090488 RepID=A0AAD6B4B5_9TELE|nr:hypothetical protein JOQ06_002378 [Pogonophryne albipinna]KAJ4938237.1 hypothetical protein JOQ06_002862 [Pogonophryne albipinna]